jgi:hypothetical protein|tara:strand:+ start:198 stop:1013 length:816 start_codon:yes stop_codon:yes gene_type:complete
MKKKGTRFNNNLIYLAIVIIVILMLIFGRKGGEEIKDLEESLDLEKSMGSGFLEIETFPGDAEIFVDGVYSGKDSTTLYNIPGGKRSVVIKKSGYEDFTVEVSIEAGKKSFLEAHLILIPAEEQEEIRDVVEEKTEAIGISDEAPEIKEIIEDEKETSKSEGMVNVGTKFLLYYDFSENEFADKRNFEQDAFSKKYKTYFVFTRFDPVNMKTIDKNINDVEKEDCAGIRDQFEWLYSGQSLCVITKENNIVAIGGEWEDTENAELIWKLFS